MAHWRNGSRSINAPVECQTLVDAQRHLPIRIHKGIIVDMSPTKCPECDSTEPTPIHDPVLAKKSDDAPVIAYRCSNQHLFLPNANAAVAGE